MITEYYKKAYRSLISFLLVLTVALSTLAVVLYYQYRDSAVLLNECRSALSKAKSDTESLGQYTRWLYMNYTRLYEFAKSLLANYSSLLEAYNNLSWRHQLMLGMLESSHKLYNEIYSSYTELKAKYDDLTKQLEILNETLRLTNKLRTYYLMSRNLGFSYINESMATVSSSSSLSVRLIRAWSVHVFPDFRPASISIPTQEAGYLVIIYNNTRGVCFTIKVANVYIVPGHYISENEYFSGEYCSAQGEIVIPVLPHQTNLKVTIPQISTGIPSGYLLLEITLHIRYISLEV